MAREGGNGRSDFEKQSWAHNQNILRFQSLLHNATHLDRHDEIRKLLRDEEEKLRSLEKDG
ncbi:hypothetical protein HHL08_09575 [Sphingobium sp. AR-3-1]|uniref:Uncharacterized protein n=2 Tax=Sphingomonadales TaxID=204457 RepID=A0A1S1HML1_9SPHN|nr:MULTISPECIES: hypothetical protein [Sphingomonadaceae]NML10397.1 hypothetical protein [Sphingobium psychrophilum]OHT21710.1 hypothetical protein BHE75_03721 [Sphingomonas haloaromaticamans]WCP12079.1 hypothetical protein sphantq_00476 [Sphingobium sp. AntQ-1]